MRMDKDKIHEKQKFHNDLSEKKQETKTNDAQRE